VNLQLSKLLLALLPIAALFLIPAADAGAQDMTVGGKWSQPAILSSCPGAGAPYVVFPRDKPTHATGKGAIVWSASPPCPGGAGAQVATLSREDIPGQPTFPRTATGRTIALSGPLAAAAGPYGRIVIAGASGAGSSDPGGSAAGPNTTAPGPARPNTTGPNSARSTTAGSNSATPTGNLLLTEGHAGGPFTTPLAIGPPASTFAFTTAYLGDVALVSSAGATSGSGADTERGDVHGHLGDIQLRVQRHHAGRFAAPTQVSTGGDTSIDALTVALDYRSDRLIAWSQRGSVYTRELPASGAPHPVQRLGRVGLGPPSGARIAAVASDDDRGIVAWSYRNAGQTSIYVARSQTGVRFTAPQLLERFLDPPDLPSYVDSPHIVRLSSESVMMAWTGAEAGHWVIRTAAIDLNGVRPPDTISAPSRDALLADLAPGPDDEVLALWTEPQETAAGLNLGSQAIFAARGFDAYPGQTAFTPGEQVAPTGPNSEATIALDPASDRAVAAWRTGAGLLAYAIRAPGGL
jgi:hypothetical protein